MLQESFGREAKFLLIEKTDGSGDMTLNESLLQMLVSCKGRYLLEIARRLMEIPNTDKKLIFIEDLSSVQVKLLHRLLGHILANGSEPEEYLNEVEGHLCLQRRPSKTQDQDCDADVMGWGTMWAQILGHAVQQASKQMTDEELASALQDSKAIAKFLPKPGSVCVPRIS